MNMCFSGYYASKQILCNLDINSCHIEELSFTIERSKAQTTSRFFIATEKVSTQNNKIIYSQENSFRFYFLLLSIVFTLFSSPNLLAQVDSTEILNDKIFQYLEDVTEDKDDSQLYELFDELISNPIDLNSATLDDLSALPFLPTLSAKRILRFIKKNKGIKNFDELKLIKSIDPDILLLLKPFVKISPIKIVKPGPKTTVHLRSRFINDLQNKKGFLTKQYLGSKLKSYQRLKASYNNFKVGGLIEKDAGEKSYTDFYSGFFQYKSKGIIKNIIAGDYVFEFGQGLAVWSPYAFSKGTDATASLNKSARNFIPYSSSDENIFFRGAASTVNFGVIKLSAFYSQNKIDATLYDSSILNLYVSGYHRTENELLKKDNTTAISFGTSINIDLSDFLILSLLHYRTKFNPPFYYKNNFALSGDKFSFTSAAYNFYVKNISLSGEFSYNGTSVASINNLYFFFNKSLTFTTSIRSYPRNYYNLYSNGFGEKSSTQNEFGFYTGIKWKTTYGTFNVYYDLFKQTFSTYTSSFPTSGNDFLLDYKYSLEKNLLLNLKYKREVKENLAFGIENIIITDNIKNNYRLELSYKLSKNIFGKNRVEIVKVEKRNDNEYGFLTLQDIKLFSDNFSFIGRIIFFDTKTYDSRIYEFENNLRGLLTNLPMFGNGFRWYFIINYQPTPKIKISARYSETYKSNINSFGNGLGEIKGNINNRFSMQIDFVL